MKQSGRHYTPNKLADVLASWAIETGMERILEPSVGNGALVRAAQARAMSLAGSKDQLRFVACDTDKTVTETIGPYLGSQDTIIEQDFLTISAKVYGDVDAVLANPPFTRNHALDKAYRIELRKKFHLTGAAGIWVPFLLHACEFLKPSGRIAFLVPGSAIFTDYGRTALARVCRHFAHVEVKRIDERSEWSSGAEERGALFLARGYLRGSSELPVPSAWSTNENGDGGSETQFSSAFAELVDSSSTLGELGKIAIGVVTGCNSVFLVSEKERALEQIDYAELLPIVSRTRHVPGLFVTLDDLRKRGEEGEKTWLLAPRDISQRFTGVRSRLARITPRQRSNTAWFNKRSPWWAVDAGPCCDAIFTYMNHTGPRLILAERGIRCTNTLHRVSFSEDVSCSQRHVAALTLVSTFGQLMAEKAGRTYGGGVIKFELKEARSLPILQPKVRVKGEFVGRINNLILCGENERARQAVDEMLLPSILGTSWKSAVTQMQSDLIALRRRRYGVKQR